jgi:hypothetical protein
MSFDFLYQKKATLPPEYISEFHKLSFIRGTQMADLGVWKYKSDRGNEGYCRQIYRSLGNTGKK